MPMLIDEDDNKTYVNALTGVRGDLNGNGIESPAEKAAVDWAISSGTSPTWQTNAGGVHMLLDASGNKTYINAETGVRGDFDSDGTEDPSENIIGDVDGDGVMDASWADTLGGPNSAVIMDRMVYKIAQSRRAGQGDMIRGDLPIQPCDQISRTSADPSADLQAGALGMITERAAGETTTNDLQAAYSGQSSTVATAATA